MNFHPTRLAFPLLVLFIYFIIYLFICFYIIQIYSGITSGRVLNGELLYTKILEVNLFVEEGAPSVGEKSS